MTGKKKIRTALVTGATGFVGSRLACRLVRDGCQVHVVVRPESDLGQLSEVEEHLIFHRHDGSTEGMIDIVRKASPEIVFHMASLFLSEHQPRDIKPLFVSNLLFGTQLIEAMKQAGVSKLVNTGTSWQHYLNEDYNPVNLYAATKQAFEDILRYYSETSPLRIITLKLFDTYGPGDPRPKLMYLLKRLAETGDPLDMSPGDQLIDLVHIDDVVEAFILAGRRLLAGQVEVHERYAVSSRHPLPLKEIVRMVSRIVGRELKINWGGRPYRNREVMVPWEGQTVLPGWEPRVGLDYGIVECLRQEKP